MRLPWAIAGVALVLAGCGSATKEPDRFDLTTPGAHTGEALPTATATPSPTATPKPKPVTKTERRVIKGWADSLRRGQVNAAADYFDVPSAVSNNTPGLVELSSVEDVREFNRTLPCGAKLLRTRRGSDGFVVGEFRLTERRNAPAPCGQGVGAQAAVAFKISDGHIKAWVRVVDPSEADPLATPTPTATPAETATPTPTPTPTETPGATVTEA
jgi:hypothetical protein